MMTGHSKRRQNWEILVSCVLENAVMTAAHCTVQQVSVALTVQYSTLCSTDCCTLQSVALTVQYSTFCSTDCTVQYIL